MSNKPSVAPVARHNRCLSALVSAARVVTAGGKAMRFKPIWRVAALGAVLAWQSALATAQELGQFIRWCEGKDTDSYEKAADACTTFIDSGYRSGTGLVWAFVNRGLWSDNLGRYDRAIQDFR